MIGQALGHYRIVEKIGAGGMGVVYRAHDEQLDRDVALKVLPAGLLADEAVRIRFRKEALALAKLNHPNIETVYEFGSADEVDFLAMELIPGETLGAKLVQGSFSSRETERLGVQLAEGLAAAHAEGVVHRDLKPGNLMLTPDGRLKILDFGLARLVQPGATYEASRTISETNTLSGTLPYMSPEQLKGLPVDVRSDLFATGAVLYEMVAGQKPFPQTQSAELIGAILHKEPLPVSLVNHHTAPGLAAVIHKCLEKEPQNRYQSARELWAALEGASSGSQRVGPKPRGPFVVAATSVLTLALVAGIALGLNVRGWRDRLLHRGKAPGMSASKHSGPIKVRRSVAVLGFKNLSGRGEKAWLSTAFSEMLTTELAAGERLRTVPGESVSRTKIDLALAESETFAPDTLARIQKNLGSDYVVMGSYLALGEKANGQVRLDVRLQDASAGETIAVVSNTGTEQELSELISHAGAQLREKLGVATGSSGEVPANAPAAPLSLPANRDAARLYAEGVAKSRAYDALGARDLLQKAVSADPNYPLAHSALASVWSTLGYDEKGKEEAKKAFDLSGKLPREERLSIEAGYRVMNKEWVKAQEIYRTLWDFFPDNLDYGYSLAMAQTWGGKPRDALATVEEMRRLPPPGQDDPHIDQAELEAAATMSDYKRMQAAAAKAAEKGKALGARRLVAGARIRECLAFKNLGQPDQGKAACEEGKQLYSSVGDRGGFARALNTAGILQQDQGNFADAKRGYDEAVAIYRQIGQKHGVVSVMNNIATMLRSQAKYTEAIQIFEQILPICREIDDKISEAIALTNLANARSGLGELAGAKKAYEDALTLYRQIGNKSNEALNLSNLASTLYLMGDLTTAKKMFDQAQALLAEAGNKNYLVYVVSGQGDVSAANGDLAGARRKYEEAISSANALGQKGPAAENQVSLAELTIEEGHPADATASLLQTLATFRSTGASDDELTAQIVLAESLLAQSKAAEAQKHLDEARALMQKSQDPATRFQFDFIAARIGAAMGKPAEAERTLKASFAQATKYGYVNYQLRIRLTLGEIEMKSGKSTEGRARLAALQRDATAKGFNLIARKAAEAQKPIDRAR
jgi:tetratricopeptide (TPR) repeat protein